MVSRAQLLALDFPSQTINRQVRRGQLHWIHRATFAVGHPRLTPRGRWMAAVLACGAGAVLSHRAAWALWELGPRPGGAVDVTAPRDRRRAIPGVRLHRSRRVIACDTRLIDGIPVTSVPRTLLDLAEILSPQRLRRALEEADRRELLDGRELDELVQHRSHGCHGLAALRAARTALNGSAPWTLSELEEAFLGLIRQAGLPEPRCNVLVEGELVDCFWPDAPLVVELDGYAVHRGRRSFEDDRRRDGKLQLAGVPVLRFTQPRVMHEPAGVLADVTAMLRRGPGA